MSYNIRREMYKSNFLDVLGRHHMYRQFESALHKAEHDLALKEAREGIIMTCFLTVNTL